MDVVEVLTDESVEVWENSRLDPYSNGRLLYVLEMDVETLCGRGTRDDACRVGVGYFRSLRMACYYLWVSRNRNVVLLVKLKNAPVL